jgi:hypothetical protein
MVVPAWIYRKINKEKKRKEKASYPMGTVGSFPQV